jgi:hypothetical protein
MCPSCRRKRLILPDTVRRKLTDKANDTVFQCAANGTEVYGLPDDDHLYGFFAMLHEQCNVPDYATAARMLEHTIFRGHIVPIMMALYYTPSKTGHLAIELLRLIVQRIQCDDTPQHHYSIGIATRALTAATGAMQDAVEAAVADASADGDAAG